MKLTPLRALLLLIAYCSGTALSTSLTGRMAMRSYQQSDYCQVNSGHGNQDFLMVKKYPLDCYACNKNRLTQEVVFITRKQSYYGNSTCAGHLTLDDVQASNVIHYVGEHEQRNVDVRVEIVGYAQECSPYIDRQRRMNDYLCQWATVTYSGVVCDDYDHSRISGNIYLNADFEVYNCSTQDAQSYSSAIQQYMQDDYSVTIDVECDGDYRDPLAKFDVEILEDNCGACATCEQFEIGIETTLDYYNYYQTYHTKQLRLTNVRVEEKPLTCHSGCKNWTVWEISGDKSYGGGMTIDEDAKKTTQQWTLECNDDLHERFETTGNHRHNGCGNIKLVADMAATKMKKYDWDWRTLEKDLDVTLKGHVEHCCESYSDCSATATKRKDDDRAKGRKGNGRGGGDDTDDDQDSVSSEGYDDYDCTVAVHRGHYRTCSQCCSNYPNGYGCDNDCGDSSRKDPKKDKDDGESTINAGAVIGVVIAVVVLLACCGGLFAWNSERKSGQNTARAW